MVSCTPNWVIGHGKESQELSSSKKYMNEFKEDKKMVINYNQKNSSNKPETEQK